MASTFDEVRAADARKRQASTRSTESAVLDGTEQLLREVPLHDVSVDRIVEASGISRATFYRHFTSKDAVVAALFARVMDEVYEAIAGFVDADPSGDAAGLLGAALASGWEVWTSHAAVNRAVSENWHRVPELEALWMSAFDRFTEAIAAQIDKERELGKAPPGTDSRQLAAMLLWSTERLRYVAGRGDSSALGNVDDILRPITDMWQQVIYGIRADPSTSLR